MNTRKWPVVGVATLALLLAPLSMAQAQTGGDFDLTWNSMDGGGRMNLSGGNYTLNGSIGQPDAGIHAGGLYRLEAGFWHQATLVFVPIVLKQ